MLEMKYEIFILLLKLSFLYFNCQAVVILSEVKAASFSLQHQSEECHSIGLLVEVVCS